jgi:Methyltransferase domain
MKSSDIIDKNYTQKYRFKGFNFNVFEAGLLKNVEFYLLLQATGAISNENRIDSIQDDFSRFTDEENVNLWIRVNYLVNKNRLTGWLYSCLIKSGKMHLVPQAVKNNLKISQNIMVRKELFYSGLILQLSKQCAINEPVWISGSFLLARCIFPGRGQVSFDYIEIFTAGDKREVLSQGIKKLGFYQEGEFYVSNNAKIRLKGFTESLFPGVAAITLKDIKRYSCSYNLGGYRCNGPTPDLLFLYLTFRCKDKKWCNIASFVSAKMCILHEEFCWDRLAEIAKLHNADKDVHVFLRAISIIFGIHMPTNFRSKLSIPVPQKLVNEHADRLLYYLLYKPYLHGFTSPQFLAKNSNNFGEYVGTPDVVVKKMLEIANIKPEDVICDLGCGDGRFLIDAVLSYKCSGFGVDYDAEKIVEATHNAVVNKVGSQLEFHVKDVLETDLSGVSIVISYLNNIGNNELLPKIKNELSPGTKVLTHQFWFSGVSPKSIVTIETGFAHYTDIYIWDLWS